MFSIVTVALLSLSSTTCDLPLITTVTLPVAPEITLTVTTASLPISISSTEISTFDSCLVTLNEAVVFALSYLLSPSY